VPHHRQPRGVDNRLFLIERHDVLHDEPVQGQRLGVQIVRNLAEDARTT